MNTDTAIEMNTTEASSASDPIPMTEESTSEPVSTIVETQPEPTPPEAPGEQDADAVEEGVPDDLTDAECAEYDQLVADVLDAKGKCYEADLELGRRLIALQAFRSQTPRHERGRTWQQVAEEDLSMDVSRTFQLMDVARVDDALREAEVEPLTVTSHGVALGPLRHEPEQIVAVVQQARERAREEGSQLTARHLTDTRRRIQGQARGEARDDTQSGVDFTAALVVDEEAWPWSDEARVAFNRVPAIDRDDVREALVFASAAGPVTAEIVADAALVVAADRAENGGRSGKPVVVGAAVVVVEAAGEAAEAEAAEAGLVTPAEDPGLESRSSSEREKERFN